MSSPEPSLTPGERFSIVLGAFFRAVLRLLILLLGGVVLAALFYFGFILIYQQAILPAQDNAARLYLMETRQADQQEQLTQRLESLQARLSELENRQILDQEALDSLQAGQNDLQQSLNTHSEQLKALEDLEKDLTDLQRAHQRTLELTRENQSALQSGVLTRQVEYDLSVLRAALLVQRARLYLEQSNFGLARQETGAARAVLAGLQSNATSEQSAELAAWIGRLDSALASLPDFPVLADNDLRTAEQLLLLPKALLDLTLTPAAIQQETLSFTPTLGGTGAATPTPGGFTPSPTPTPTRTP